MSRCGRLRTSIARFVYVAAMAACVMLSLQACSNDDYSTGDGKYSYLTADLVLLQTNSSKTVTAAVLDDGTRLSLTNPFTAEWTTVPDSVYRALLYYDHDDTSGSVKARSVSQVHVLRLAAASQTNQMCTDPLGLESVWLAKNRSFINLSLLLKSGSTEADARQVIGVVLEDVTAGADGKRRAVLRLYHDQASVPQYYTVQQYASISTSDIDADVVELHVNTYSGEVVRTIDMNG